MGAYDYLLRIYDTETGQTVELLTFESDAAAEAYFHDIEEAYPENFDFEVIWKLKAGA